MPLFDYRCNECEAVWEELRLGSTGYNPPACPHCGSSSVTQLIGTPAIKLKGTGWYETDFKTKPKTEE